MEIIPIRYYFRFGDRPDAPDAVEEVFDLQLDAKTLELQDNIPKILPDWTKLDFYQCSNCPLDVRKHPFCPLAANLVNVVNRFDSLFSYYETNLVVTTKERMISQVTTVQRALGSLMGLVIATCGCPHTVFFKPMARFHLPLANNQETVYRAASMYLLAQYFMQKEGKPVDWELKGLEDIYNNIQLVNYTIAERLRAATRSDSVLNALVELDIFAQTLSLVIEDSLEDIRFLFDSYLAKKNKKGKEK
ncbi:MAG: hypothetical protein JSV88_23770 [Candidatus Aminicenantes bacterium]|nr:MAG: hypothetical protein JSV88_23770 [Candidatus Aminicenantes bacterium]